MEKILICRNCNKPILDYKEYRKSLCRECFNAVCKKAKRKQASTLEGYFKLIIADIKNNKRRYYEDNNLDLDFILDLYHKQNGKCALSGVNMTWGFGEYHYENHERSRNPYNASIDRIDNSKGYTKDNVWLICSIVNIFKGRYSTELVLDMCDKIVKHSVS